MGVKVAYKEQSISLSNKIYFGITWRNYFVGLQAHTDTNASKSKYSYYMKYNHVEPAITSQLVGKLIYLIEPSISCFVGIISQFMQKPT